MAKPGLVPADFLDDAIKLKCEPIDIRVVANVESKGYGFDPEDFPKTLFEGHHFHRLTNGKYDASHPSLSYPTWTKKFYRDWRGEKERLAIAMGLNREAAIQSASWGTFQVMGFNYKDAGCKTLQEFVNKMCGQSNDHLDLFTQLILTWGLDDELRTHNYDPFAKRYNGTGQVAYYAGEMRKELARLKRGG